jgi:hypothetical protein
MFVRKVRLMPDVTKVDLLLYGNRWQSSGDEEAGWELVRCLESSDPEIRVTAETYMAEAGPRSIKLLQAAVASGTVQFAAAEGFLDAWLALMFRDGTACSNAFGDFETDC